MSAYIERSDVYARYGQPTVRAWANMEGIVDEGDGLTSEIDDRIDAECDSASEFIDDTLRGSKYSGALPISAESGSVPLTIVKICMKIVGYELSIARGARDYDPQSGKPISKWQADYDTAMATLERIRTGDIVLDVTT